MRAVVSFSEIATNPQPAAFCSILLTVSDKVDDHCIPIGRMQMAKEGEQDDSKDSVECYPQSRRF